MEGRRAPACSDRVRVPSWAARSACARGSSNRCGIDMTAATWITMILVMVYVWGGVTIAVTTAMRKEAKKSSEG